MQAVQDLINPDHVQIVRKTLINDSKQKSILKSSSLNIERKRISEYAAEIIEAIISSVFE